MQVTVINFSGQPIEGTVHSDALLPRRTVVCAATGEDCGTVDDLHSFRIALPAYGGKFLVLGAEEVPVETGLITLPDLSQLAD